jgi:1-phosphatidylinositol-3-phosphate 5-kinase
MLKQSRAEKRTAREPKLTTDGSEAFMPDDRSVAESTSTWGVVNIEEAANPRDELRMPSSKQPWAICEFCKPLHV